MEDLVHLLLLERASEEALLWVCLGGQHMLFAGGRVMGALGDPGRNWLREKHPAKRCPVGRGRKGLPRSRLESRLCSYWQPSF